MAQLIVPDPSGDTPKTVEDKTRDLAANQGLNDNAMWLKIDTEIASARSAGKLKGSETYSPAQKHGSK